MNTHVKTKVANEPVLTAVGLGAIAAAILHLLIAFGVPVTTDQAEAIKSVVEILAPVVIMAVAAWVARSKVSPVNKE